MMQNRNPASFITNYLITTHTKGYTMIQFGETTKEEMGHIEAIIKRVRKIDTGYDGLTITMDLTATHLNTPLDFKKLSEADDFNLFHDVFGIRKHLNRQTGNLKDCFLPRCSK